MILLPSSIDRPISPDASLSNPFSICTCALWISPNSSGPSIVTVHSIAASLKSAIFMKRSWLRVFYSPSPQSFCRFQVIYLADSKDAATVKEFADFLEAHGGKREAVTDASIDMGAAFEAGIVNRRRKVTPDRRPKLTPLVKGADGSARPGGGARRADRPHTRQKARPARAVCGPAEVARAQRHSPGVQAIYRPRTCTSIGPSVTLMTLRRRPKIADSEFAILL